MNTDFLRQTGRTTRMIEEAIRLHKSGQRVAILFSTPGEVSFLKRTRRQDLTGIELYDLEMRDLRIDWNEMQIRYRGDRVCSMLVDHHAIEVEYRSVLTQLRRWDAQPGMYGYKEEKGVR
jgi:hypothetical protein